jgi:hypothetical protein
MRKQKPPLNLIILLKMKREIDWEMCRGLTTRIYRNLQTGTMSLQQKIDKSWLVVGHVTNAVIEYPSFHISQGGKNRVIREKRKNVHAWAVGRLVGVKIDLPNRLEEIYYCPYNTERFAWKKTGEPIESPNLLVVIENRVFCDRVSNPPQLTLF